MSTQDNKKVLILGGTGRTGKYVVTEALEEGFEVNCLVRRVPKFAPKHERLTHIVGTPYEKDNLTRAIHGCQLVIIALSISRNSEFPWSQLRSPRDLLSRSMENVLTCSEIKNIERIVICSAWGVGESRKDIPFWFDLLIEHSNIKPAYDDHYTQEELLEHSDLDWVIVRPVGLTNSTQKKVIRESFDNEPKPFLTISRKNVAQYLVKALRKPELSRKKVVISENYLK
ncbi:MAG: NAD(P)H-binding protein [Bacteroidota bacterium]